MAATPSTAEKLVQALQALYHNTNSEVQKQADSWLDEFQHTAEAWQVCDSLLHAPGTVHEVQYFCAQTLKKKSVRDYEELPLGSSAGLRDSLVVLLLKFGGSEAATRKQLCLAIIALAAHMAPQEWDSSTPLAWLTMRLSQAPQEQSLPCMLELLILMPQESRGYPSMHPERRRQFAQELCAAAPNAIDMLSSFLAVAQTSSKIMLQVIEAYGAWIRLGCGGDGRNGHGSARTLPGADVLASHPLTQTSLAGLGNIECFDAAVETVSELVRSTTVGGDPMAPAVQASAQPLVAVLVPQVMALAPRFATASRASAGEEDPPGVSSDTLDDDETAKGMARLFAEVGEAYVGLIATGNPAVMPPVEALLEVARYPEDTVAFICFEFWSQLSQLLDPLSGLSRSLPTHVPPEEAERRRQLFAPAFLNLIQSIQGRVKYPDGFEGWSPSALKDFKKNRYFISDTIRDAASVVGVEVCIETLAQPLKELSAAVAAGQAFDWRAAEAALYCIRSVHQSRPAPGNPTITALLASLPTLPHQPHLLYTSCLTVAAYSVWLRDSLEVGQGSELLPPIMAVIGTGMRDQEAACSAAKAVANLCSDCGMQLGPYMPGMMEMYNLAVGPMWRAGAGGVQERLHAIEQEDLLEIIQGIAAAVSAFPEAQMLQGMQMLLTPLVPQMEALVPTGQVAVPRTLLPAVERVTAVFRHMRLPPASEASVAGSFHQLWPMLERAFPLAHGQERLIEKLCKLVKYAMRACGVHSGALLGPICAMLKGCFQSQRCSSYLYAASECVAIFAEGPAATPEAHACLADLLASMLATATAILKSLEDFKNQPDVADDTFLLALKVLDRAPALLVPTPVYPALLDCAIVGLMVQHREASVSILDFLKHAVQIAAGNPAAAAAALPRGPLITTQLIRALGGGLPTNRFEEVAETLLALMEAGTGAELAQWCQGALASVPPAAVPDADRAAFMATVSDPALSYRQRLDGLYELSEICRRNRSAQDTVCAALKLPGEP